MTRLITILTIISTGLLVSGAAVAPGSAGTVTRGVALVAAEDFYVPPEWAGIWNTNSTSSICGGGTIGSSSDPDTLCAGAPLLVPGEEGLPITYSCSGTVDATTVDVTCTGSTEIFQDCQQMVTVEYDIVRTGDEYTSTVVMTTTHVGTGVGCSDIPDSCIQSEGTGTRVAPAPGTCPQTPVTSASWGVIKTLYGE
jgi:hypothetical protein